MKIRFYCQHCKQGVVLPRDNYIYLGNDSKMTFLWSDICQAQRIMQKNDGVYTVMCDDCISIAKNNIEYNKAVKNKDFSKMIDLTLERLRKVSL